MFVEGLIAFAMSDSINLNNISIVLHQPRHPENIGAAARAMCNMGIKHLVVVDPKNLDLIKVLKMATHAAAAIVKQIETVEDIQEALSKFNYIVGTTARLGKHRQVIRTPSRLTKKLIPISKQNRIAIVFGPEDKGLSNNDIRYCHELVNIPTGEFSSLNLSQAVMVICYELFLSTQKENKEFTPRLATRHELEGMYAQLKDILVRISFINPENPDYWMNNLRYFFTRLGLRAREVSIIRGICRQIDWYGKKCYRDGLEMQPNSTHCKKNQ
jgi:tRNA/rRNA methyltransferase